MKTTRRGWLAAISSLIALPLLPKPGRAADKPGPATDSLVDHFARQAYPQSPDSRPDMELWDLSARHPVNAAELQSREEFLRNELHHLRIRKAGMYATLPLECELREIARARTILHHQPTGRPLTFHYSGGTTPGQARSVLPTLIFHVDSANACFPTQLTEVVSARSLYLQAYCLQRLAPRTFRLDRIKNLTPFAHR